MMDAATIDISGFNSLVGDLVKLGGPNTKPEAVLRDETAHLLENCIRFTPTARAEVIDQRTLYKERKEYSVYSGGITGKNARLEDTFISVGQQNQKVWYVTPNTSGLGTTISETGERRHGRHLNRAGNVTKAWHCMTRPDRHWPDWMWAAYQREEADRLADYQVHLAKELAAGRASRGLSARSWLDIADDLGLDIRIAQYIRRAVPRNGKTYVNGTGQVERAADSVTFTLTNFQPILLKNDGAGILQRAISTRQAAFEKAMEVGIFDDVAQLSRRYPALLAA